MTTESPDAAPAIPPTVTDPVPATADLWDAHPDVVAVLDPGLLRFGARPRFAGPAHTLAVFEDNSLVRAALETPGRGRVLVVDGGGSLRRALVGDRLAQLAIDHGWSGLVVWGAIRDAGIIDGLPLGLRALGTTPRKSIKRGQGVAGEAVRMLGVTIAPGSWVYADEDGVLVAPRKLTG
jgi:regulator of ribonuclease activity A